MGVVSLLSSILILLYVPFFFQNENLKRFFIHTSYYKILFWFFFFNCLILGWIGGKPIESPYYEIGQVSTIFYFFYFYLIFFLDLFLVQDLRLWYYNTIFYCINYLSIYSKNYFYIILISYLKNSNIDFYISDISDIRNNIKMFMSYRYPLFMDFYQRIENLIYNILKFLRKIFK
jgi:hypothetical protein